MPNPSLGDAESWSDDGGEKSRTEWATIKPLGEIFGAGRLARILLVDDDSFKAAHSESANMVSTPPLVLARIVRPVHHTDLAPMRTLSLSRL